MLNRIIAFSLSHRFLVLLIAISIAIYGAFVAQRLSIDVLPDLNRPTVTVITEAHGLVPEDVEKLVTRHIEGAVNGATGVTRVRSSSGIGLSVVYVEFDWKTDIYRNRQVVQEKIQLAVSQLPPGIVPTMAPISSIMGQVQLIGVRSKSGKTPVTEIRALVDQAIRYQLLAVRGVAQITVTGGAQRQLQVHIDSDKMRAYDVGYEDVADAIRASNLNASGGILHIGNKGPLVNVTGLIRNERDLERAIVSPDPVRPIRVGDVARVVFGPAAVRAGDAGVNGKEGVIIVVSKQPSVDTLKLAEALELELEAIRGSIDEDIVLLPSIYRQAEFIERAVSNVTSAVIDGSLLVVIVLFLFLLNFRTTLITLTAIPLSVAITAIIFDLAGVSINTMTLGGLAVAVGALVDDAIVDVENVFRRLRQNVQAGNPRAALDVVFRASSEVRRPILIGTLVVAAVYVPLFALTGMEGRLFTPIGVTYIVSIMASLIVSLTLTPVLCSWLLPKASRAAAEQDNFFVRKVQGVANRVIAFSIAHPARITVVFGAVLIASLAALAGRGSEFLPPFDEGSAQVNLILPPGTSLETSNRFGLRLEKEVLKVTGVLGVGRRTGRAEGDEHAEGVETTEMIISFDPEVKRTREDVLHEIRDRIKANFPGVPTSTEQPIAHLLSHLLSGVYAQVAIKIQGDDLGVLRSTAKEVAHAVGGIPGVIDLIKEPSVLVEQVEIKPRRTDCANLGVRVDKVAATVELALEGTEVSRLKIGQYSYPIVMRLEADDRADLEAIRNLVIFSEEGVRLNLRDVADVRITRTSNKVQRENVRRRVVVQHNVEGRSLGEVVGDVELALDPIREKLPPGYTIKISGQFEARAEAARVITILSFVSLLAMFGLVFSHFRSVNLSIQTLINIPMAFVGAAAFLLLTDQTMSVATLVGFISLGGIAARNKILLLDHYIHLLAEEGEAFSKDMIVRAGQERIVPVLMTALTSGIALLPLVLSPGEPGRELLYPVASVIVGGLISTTLLDLLLSPGLFWLFGRTASENVASSFHQADSSDVQA